MRRPDPCLPVAYQLFTKLDLISYPDRKSTISYHKIMPESCWHLCCPLILLRVTEVPRRAPGALRRTAPRCSETSRALRLQASSAEANCKQAEFDLVVCTSKPASSG